MTPYEMGRISAFLIKHRKLEDRQDKRGLQREEKDLASILREASIDEIRDLEEMMSGQGFVLVARSSPGLRRLARLATQESMHYAFLTVGKCLL